MVIKDMVVGETEAEALSAAGEVDVAALSTDRTTATKMAIRMAMLAIATASAHPCALQEVKTEASR